MQISWCSASAWVSWVQGLIDAAQKEQESAAAVREAAQVAIQKAALVKEAEILARNQKAEQARLEREAAGRQNAARLERLKQVCLTSSSAPDQNLHQK